MGPKGQNDPYAVSEDVDLSNAAITVRIPQLDAMMAGDSGAPPNAVGSKSADSLPLWKDG